MSIKVVFSSDALETIDIYCWRLRDFYVSLYTDTGIWAEDVIIHDYRKKSEFLVEMIIDSLTAKASTDILPFEVYGNRKKSTFHIEHRRVEILYEEKDETRIIREISIQYKK